MNEQTALTIDDCLAAPAICPDPPRSLEPILLEIRAGCVFEAKGCATCGKPKGSKAHTPKKTATCTWRRQNGCARCGRAKGDDSHYGAPPSLNVFGGRDPNTYRSMIESWKSVVLDKLREALPPGVVFEHVLVEGAAIFPKHSIARDQGNHRVLLEKAVGDALVDGGWLVSDTWDRYEFGGLEQREEPGVSATLLTLFPRA